MGTIILVILAIAVVATFAAQNAAPVSLAFLTAHFEASLAVIAVLFFMAGMLAGMAALSWMRMRRANKNEKDQKQ